MSENLFVQANPLAYNSSGIIIKRVNSPLGDQCSREKEMGRGEIFELWRSDRVLHSVRWIFIVDLFHRKDLLPPENLKHQPGILYSIALREINLAGRIACKIQSVFRWLRVILCHTGSDYIGRKRVWCSLTNN